MLNKKLI